MAWLWVASCPGAAPALLGAGACWAMKPISTTPAPIARNPISQPQEAIGAGAIGAGAFGLMLTTLSLASMRLFLSSCRLSTLLPVQLAQFSQCLLGPALVGVQFQLPESQHHLPVGRIGVP